MLLNRLQGCSPKTLLLNIIIVQLEDQMDQHLGCQLIPRNVPYMIVFSFDIQHCSFRCIRHWATVTDKNNKRVPRFESHHQKSCMLRFSLDRNLEPYSFRGPIYMLQGCSISNLVKGALKHQIFFMKQLATPSNSSSFYENDENLYPPVANHLTLAWPLLPIQFVSLQKASQCFYIYYRHSISHSIAAVGTNLCNSSALVLYPANMSC